MARTNTHRSPEQSPEVAPLTSEDVFAALGFVEAPVNDVSHLTTVSAKIRALTAQGMKRGEIAKALNIRYQHVRNVQLRPLKKGEAK